MASEQTSVRCVIMRGGTSKGAIFAESDLPKESRARDALIMRLMGTPDPRQIDGLGGADPLTSKICIIGPSAHADADVDYTFGQVGIEEPFVSYATMCGNLSAAVGVYAIEEGLVAAKEPETIVRIFNTNTKTLLLAYVPIRNGRPAVEGDYSIPGVPGTAAEIRLDFSRTTGSTTGKLLPTGARKDRLFIPALGRSIDVSILDVAKPNVFFLAEDIGLKGTEAPDDFTSDILNTFWSIRGAAAEAIGLPSGSRIPTPVAVAPPASYQNYMTKQMLSEQSMDFAARRVLGPPPRIHKAFAATGAVCTAVAALLPGTTVYQVCRPIHDNKVRIGHPTGVFPVYARVNVDGPEVLEASYSRTARRIMDGNAFVPGAPHSKT